MSVRRPLAIDLFDRAVALDRELEDAWAEACDRVNLRGCSSSRWPD